MKLLNTKETRMEVPLLNLKALRIAREFKVSEINKPLCKYRDTPDSLSKKDKETVFKFRRQVIEKNYKLSQDLNHPIVPALYKKSLARLFFHAGRYSHEKENC